MVNLDFLKPDATFEQKLAARSAYKMLADPERNLTEEEINKRFPAVYEYILNKSIPNMDKDEKAHFTANEIVEEMTEPVSFVVNLENKTNEEVKFEKATSLINSMTSEERQTVNDVVDNAFDKTFEGAEPEQNVDVENIKQAIKDYEEKYQKEYEAYLKEKQAKEKSFDFFNELKEKNDLKKIETDTKKTNPFKILFKTDNWAIFSHGKSKDNDLMAVDIKNKKSFKIDEEKKRSLKRFLTKTFAIMILTGTIALSLAPGVSNIMKPGAVDNSFFKASAQNITAASETMQNLNNVGAFGEQIVNTVNKELESDLENKVSENADIILPEGASSFEEVKEEQILLPEAKQEKAIEQAQEVKEQTETSIDQSENKNINTPADQQKDESVAEDKQNIGDPIVVPVEEQESDPIVIVDEEHETDPIELEDDQNIPTSDEELDDDKKEETNPEVKDENDVPLDEDVTPEVVQPQDNDEPDLGPGVEIQPEIKSEIMKGIFVKDGKYYYNSEFDGFIEDKSLGDGFLKAEVIEKLVEFAKINGSFHVENIDNLNEGFDIYENGQVGYVKPEISDKPEVIDPANASDKVWNASSVEEQIKNAKEAIEEEAENEEPEQDNKELEQNTENKNLDEEPGL